MGDDLGAMVRRAREISVEREAKRKEVEQAQAQARDRVRMSTMAARAPLPAAGPQLQMQMRRQMQMQTQAQMQMQAQVQMQAQMQAQAQAQAKMHSAGMLGMPAPMQLAMLQIQERYIQQQKQQLQQQIDEQRRRGSRAAPTSAIGGGGSSGADSAAINDGGSGGSGGAGGTTADQNGGAAQAGAAQGDAFTYAYMVAAFNALQARKDAPGELPRGELAPGAEGLAESRSAASLESAGGIHLAPMAKLAPDMVGNMQLPLEQGDGGDGGAHAAPAPNMSRWTEREDETLRRAVRDTSGDGHKNATPGRWSIVSEAYFGGTRTSAQCLHRWNKVLAPGLVKGLWTPEEDAIIREMRSNGITKWSEIAKNIPGRIGKQCRERWFNHLDPTLRKGAWTPDEDAQLIKAQAELGNRWTKIARLIAGRSENDVKNRWNSAFLKAHRREVAAKAMAGVSDAAVSGSAGDASGAAADEEGRPGGAKDAKGGVAAPGGEVRSPVRTFGLRGLTTRSKVCPHCGGTFSATGFPRHESSCGARAKPLKPLQ